MQTFTTTEEAAAYRAFKVFIRNGSGSRMFKRDEQGRILKDAGGTFLRETLEEACMRRWRECPQTTRTEFMAYAKAARSAA